MKRFEDFKHIFKHEAENSNPHDSAMISELLSSEEIPKWALWVRTNDGVARCSNHIEAFHKIQNFKTANSH